MYHPFMRRYNMKLRLLMIRITLCVRLFILIYLCYNVLIICVLMLKLCERLKNLFSL